MTRFGKVTGLHQKVKATRVGWEARRACELHRPTTHVEDLIDAAEGDRHLRHEDAPLDGVKKRVVGPIAAVGVPCTIVV